MPHLLDWHPGEFSPGRLGHVAFVGVEFFRALRVARDLFR